MLAHGLTLCAYAGLMALQCIWYLAWHPPQRLPGEVVLLVALTPLVFPLPGLIRDRPDSTIWACLVSLFYFIHGATEAWVNPVVWGAALTEVGLSLAVMAGASLHLTEQRWRAGRP